MENIQYTSTFKSCERPSLLLIFLVWHFKMGNKPFKNWCVCLSSSITRWQLCSEVGSWVIAGVSVLFYWLATPVCLLFKTLTVWHSSCNFPGIWPFVPFQCPINLSLDFQLPRKSPACTVKTERMFAFKDHLISLVCCFPVELQYVYYMEVGHINNR